MPIKRQNVIVDIINAIGNGTLIPSFHAEAQMRKRNIEMSDIEEAIFQAQREDLKDSLTKDGTAWKYALRGKNDEGDKDLRIIVAFDDPKVIIITAIDKNKREDEDE